MHSRPGREEEEKGGREILLHPQSPALCRDGGIRHGGESLLKAAEGEVLSVSQSSAINITQLPAENFPWMLDMGQLVAQGHGNNPGLGLLPCTAQSCCWSYRDTPTAPRALQSPGGLSTEGKALGPQRAQTTTGLRGDPQGVHNEHTNTDV